MNYLPRDETKELKRRVPDAKPMIPYAAPPWQEGELHKANASVGPFSDHFLAHFKGWTILIAYDNFDDDWGAQAISVKVKTVPQFVQINSSEKPMHLMADEFYATKEKAFEAVKSKISQYMNNIR